ncbi:MAG: preprotein translocase subunit SecG [Fimbriimonadaceae bacterium]|nr:preprotein translocase subunit SecG [Fimbriimonadaceae bacterium]
MELGYRIAIGLGILVAVLFTALVVLTGKGDAMSGGGSIRTTYKGKASFDDQISKWTLILGALFMALMLVVDGLSRYISKS